MWAMWAMFLPVWAQTNLPFPVQVAVDVTRVGVLQQSGLGESSGLAASPRYPGVFWTHNDTEFPTFLFAINQQGEHLGAFELKGAQLIDWEGLAFDEAGALYLADLGTNGMPRSHSAIHRVDEPDVSQRWGPVQVRQSWYIRYPGEREDAEGFFVHGGFGYVVTKYDDLVRRVNLYRFPLADESSSILLELVARIPVTGNVSDATLTPDGSVLALLTSDGITSLYIQGDPATAATAHREEMEFQNTTLEGAAMASNGILVTADSTPEVLLFTNPLLRGAPQWVVGLTNVASFVGRTVTLVAEVLAAPVPVYEWRFNGELVAGATNASLVVSNLTPASAGTYELTARNPAGEVRTQAQLTVRERVPDVRITEVMSSTAPGTAATADWWELTSFDPEPVDLSGWRFNDSTGGLADAFVIPEGTWIRPGESVVFVELLTPAQFREWWGGGNVPAEVPIITFSGTALSFRAAGDSLRLWNRQATDDATVVARVDFGQAQNGVSFQSDPVTGLFGGNSVLGENGVFQAATGADIGSPGYYPTSAGPGRVPDLRVETLGHGIRLGLSAVPVAGERYEVEAAEDIRSATWTGTGLTLGGGKETVVIEGGLAEGARFYRVRQVTGAGPAGPPAGRQ